ncbi:hypothetical protein BWQ93_05835 [Sphingopyxis sp. QXT-31]|uniref:hypothetical protein n=1 Tax=Sphingopyxis sp. QXT-31 TaxID=1357916 RepID=UPI00097946EC|nr:hypothetical protein [Sphingopyxis sp. QXT-31]APZ98053.1 hypothetical protein BWQ93_05835 [Sphingopyxis sp. QXT-31]
MQTPLEKSLLAEVEAFLERTEVAPSRLGLDALNDGAVVSQLRAGTRSLSLKNADRLLAYMRDYRAPSEKG